MTGQLEHLSFIEVKIFSILTNLFDSMIFLDELKGSRILPIPIGAYEANAIAVRFLGYSVPRPSTHDLLFNLIKKEKLSLKYVCINKVESHTFFAYLFLESEKKVRNIASFKLDCRPSDALALAVRFACPIYVLDSVFEKVKVLSKPISKDEVNQFKNSINSLKPSDIINNLMNTKKEREQ